MTPSRYAAGLHILVSRRNLDKGPIDEALNPFGLEREIVTIVGGYLSRRHHWVAVCCGALVANGTKRTIQPRPRLSAFGVTADNRGFWPAMVCPLLTHKRHWHCTAARI